MKKLPNLADMTCKKMLVFAKEMSGLTLEEISEKSGIPMSSIKQYFDENRTDYYPTPYMIPRLCKALGNEIIIDWQCQQMGGYFVRLGETDCVSVQLLMATLTKEFSEVLREDGLARLDEKYDKRELSSIEKELTEMLQRGNKALKCIREKKAELQ